MQRRGLANDVLQQGESGGELVDDNRFEVFAVGLTALLPFQHVEYPRAARDDL